MDTASITHTYSSLTVQATSGVITWWLHPDGEWRNVTPQEWEGYLAWLQRTRIHRRLVLMRQRLARATSARVKALRRKHPPFVERWVQDRRPKWKACLEAERRHPRQPLPPVAPRPHTPLVYAERASSDSKE